MRRVQQLLLQVITNGLGWAGVALICYGIMVAQSGEHFHPIEKIVHAASSTLTLIATALTAGSVYMSPNPRPPEQISTAIVAPVVIASCFVALGASLWMPISEVILSGFAILGLSGALFRLGPNRGQRSVQPAEEPS